MLETLKTNPLGSLIAQSDAISIAILLLLFGMSIITWSIFLGKLISFRIQKRHFSRVLIKLHMAHQPHDITVIINTEKDTTPGMMLSETITAFNYVHDKRTSLSASPHPRFDTESLQRSIEAIVDTALIHEESYLSILSTCAAVAPLLGLLGTVWGLIYSFLRISELRTADIATVAPGIAQALITTFAGLMVAIPALVMYNYLLVYCKRIEKDIYSIADRLAHILYPLI